MPSHSEQIGIATLQPNGVVVLQVRAEGDGLIGDIELRLTVAAVKRQGWRLGGRLIKGVAVPVLAFVDEAAA